MNRFPLAVLLGLLGGLACPSLGRADQVYQATDATPTSPLYALALPNFFGGNSKVLLSFTDVTFTDATSTNTARLQGTVEVIRGNPTGNDPFYTLDVHFNKVTDTSHIQNYNPNYSYYTIQSNGVELVSKTNPSDVTSLATFPTDNSMPFQVGLGANNLNKDLGAAGWLAWVHQYNGQIITGDTDETHGDFLMDLTPVPEPPGMALALSGLAGFGLAMWVRRSRVPA